MPPLGSLGGGRANDSSIHGNVNADGTDVFQENIALMRAMAGAVCRTGAGMAPESRRRARVATESSMGRSSALKNQSNAAGSPMLLLT